MLTKFWHDETGGILCAEIVMVGTVLVCGVITGLASLRDAVITELGDLAAAVGAFDQSFTVMGVTGHSGASASASNVDLTDLGDVPDPQQQIRCLIICSPVEVLPGNEGMGT